MLPRCMSISMYINYFLENKLNLVYESLFYLSLVFTWVKSYHFESITKLTFYGRHLHDVLNLKDIFSL